MEDQFTIGIFLFLFGAVGSLIAPGGMKNYMYLLPALGAVLLVVSGYYLSSGGQVSFSPIPLVHELQFVFRGDSLSGFFVAVLSILTVAVSIFSVGYTKNMRNSGSLGFLYNLFILGMYAVILSGNIITFLIAWETMSLVSYFLVTFERDSKSARAGLVYAVMTHIGTAFIAALFFMLYSHTGSMDFEAMKTAVPAMPSWIKSTIFIFAVIGFGTKAGIVPLHTWLPRAHPAAPSNISALMSGVMIKTGIYGFLRIGVDVLGGGPEWWGITILAVGAISSVLGVLYALMEHDLKRLLAYHSVENIGIIFLGVGASMIFANNGLLSLSAIALTAGLYHTLNHAVFKGLLFMGAGSILHATHVKNMEEMGGLIKVMPYTGIAFLIGSVSICALPPFNGFVSEWLTYQALILGFQASSVSAKILFPLAGAALALTGALAAACFVKAFGISFLGVPRSRHAMDVKESPSSMISGMGLLAILCLVLGIFPDAVIRMVSAPVFQLTGGRIPASGKPMLHVTETSSTLSPLGILLTVGAMSAGVLLFAFLAGGKRKSIRLDPWDCGMMALTSRMQYTATAFTKPIRMIFKRIYLPKRDIRISYFIKPFFVKSLKYHGEITPFFEKYLYLPLNFLIHGTAEKIRILQSGSLHLYLGYILATLILLLIFGD